MFDVYFAPEYHKIKYAVFGKKFNSIKFVYAHVHVWMTIISDTVHVIRFNLLSCFMCMLKKLLVLIFCLARENNDVVHSGC